MATSVVDEQGKVRIPEEVKRQMGLRPLDIIMHLAGYHNAQCI